MRGWAALLLLRPTSTLGIEAIESSGAARWARLPAQQARHLHGGVSLDLAIGPSYTVWGANTGVGKTLGSMGLARAARALQLPLLYIKPVQTGFPQDSDARSVALACGLKVSSGAHAAQLLPAAPLDAPTMADKVSDPSVVKVLYAWSRACGPHEAMADEGRTVSDSQILSSVLAEMADVRKQLARGAMQHEQPTRARALTLLETAGGVASPAPSGDLQCDMLRPLRFPCILIGDARLGGISATISAYDSLTLRGYDVDAILLLEPPAADQTEGPGLKNAAAIRRHLGRAVHRLGMSTEVLSLPGCAPPTPEEMAEARGGLDAPVKAWLEHTQGHFESVVKLLLQRHAARVERLESMAKQASKQIWWPFTQHASLTEGAVQVIDSRCGEHWQVLEQQPQPALTAGADASDSQLATVYDACSSWWTQAVPAQWQPEVAQAVAYAAGRYLHVMFPENAHEPAVQLAGRLLDTVGRGWAQRVFYSDDGSTAIEVALKMAFRKYMHDHGMTPEPTAGAQSVPELQVLGMQNSYHGDTLGAMDCVAPSVFNSPLQAAWYRGRGLFLDPPYVALSKGRWGITQVPAWLQSDAAAAGWGSLGEVLSEARDRTELTHVYRRHIEAEMQRHEAAGRGRLAAAILEPVLQGAGGMLMVDPQFQRAMVQVCRERGIPVIFDEVMTGLYRLGSISAAQLLRCQPDLACYAKILTAGVVPMAVTLTSEAVFEAYKGPSKLQALLHGHSYTAYPVGCAAALASLDIVSSPYKNPNLCAPKVGASSAEGSSSSDATGSCCRAAAGGAGAQCDAPCGLLLPLWEGEQVDRLSHHPAVSRVVAIGTVLAVEVTSGGAEGYAAGGAAVKVARRLRSRHGIFCRPLGPVVYLMVPPTSDRAHCQVLLSALAQELDAVAAAGDSNSEEGVVV